MAESTLAIILGGGAGTRLYPLTATRAKPAVPFGGKYRLIDIPIANCINSGIHRMFVLTQFNSKSLNHHIYYTYKFDSFRDGFVDIITAQQTPESEKWFQGTADAVRQNLPYLSAIRCNEYLVLSGDHLYLMDYGDFIKKHRQMDAAASISAIPVSIEEAERMGILLTNEDDLIVDFWEKPSRQQIMEEILPNTPPALKAKLPEGKPLLASMGIYVFKPSFLVRELGEHDYIDFGKDVIPNAIQKEKVVCYFYDDYWMDIGTISSFFNAHMDLTSFRPPYQFYDPQRPVYSRARFLPGSRLQDCSIYHSIISDGCRLSHSRISKCVIGIRSIIQSGCDLEEVLLMGGDFYQSPDYIQDCLSKKSPIIGIGENAIIRRAIIDKNAAIGNDCRLVNEKGLEHFEGPFFTIRDGIIIIPKNATVPAGTVI